MLKINIICVGTLKEKFWQSAQQEYLRRMNGIAKVNIIEIKEYKVSESINDSIIGTILENESKNILNQIPAKAFVVALCIEGKNFDSLSFSNIFQQISLKGVSEIVFIIGGSFGLDEKIKKRADLKFSMSELTFPHQLARVMLCEQIYRGFQISLGTKYHK